MKSILAVVGICAILLVGGYFLLGVRGKVLKNKFTDQLDELIGKSEIKKQKINDGIKGLDKAIDTIMARRIRFELQEQNLKKEVDDGDKKLKETKDKLASLKSDLADGSKTTFVFNEKRFNKKELEDFADNLIEAYKLAQPEQESKRRTYETIKSAATNLRDQENSYIKDRDFLTREMRMVEAKLTEASTLKEAAKAMGDTEDGGLANKVAELKQDVKKLNEDADVNRALEEAKWKKSTTKSDLDKLDEMLKTATDTSKTRLDKIDEILGTKPAGKDK